MRAVLALAGGVLAGGVAFQLVAGSMPDDTSSQIVVDGVPVSDSATLEAALENLAQVQPVGLQRRLALAALRAFDGDAAAIERVRAVLPDVDPLAFEVDALVDLADRDPAAALRAIVSKERSELQYLLVGSRAGAVTR